MLLWIQSNEITFHLSVYRSSVNIHAFIFYTCVYICAYDLVYIHTCICVFVYINIYACRHVYVCEHACM